jgi:predicted amidohydrolase
MRVAAVQLKSTADKDRNLDAAERLVRAAAADGCELVALPEMWNQLAPDDQMVAEPLDGPSLDAASKWAAHLGVHLLAGSIKEVTKERPFNTSVLFGPDGQKVAVYRKIHLFDVAGAGGVSFCESANAQEGRDLVIGEVEGRLLGLSICYDLRFPELYRILALRGAEILAVPSAFTSATGKDHWEVLLRARAIEDQAFVLAPNQAGFAPPDVDLWGHSAIIDPWGRTLAMAEADECVVAVDLDFEELVRVRKALPSLSNRRPAAYEWPLVTGSQ